PPRNATHIVFRLAKTIPNSPKHQVDVTTTSSSSQHDSDSAVEATLYAPGAGTSENPHAHDQASTITPPPPVLALPEYLRRPTVTPEEKEEEEEEDGNELQRVPTVLIAGLLKKRARRSGGPPTRQLSRVSRIERSDSIMSYRADSQSQGDDSTSASAGLRPHRRSTKRRRKDPSEGHVDLAVEGLKTVWEREPNSAEPNSAVTATLPNPFGWTRPLTSSTKSPLTRRSSSRRRSHAISKPTSRQVDVPAFGWSTRRKATGPFEILDHRVLGVSSYHSSIRVFSDTSESTRSSSIHSGSQRAQPHGGPSQVWPLHEDHEFSDPSRFHYRIVFKGRMTPLESAPCRRTAFEVVTGILRACWVLWTYNVVHRDVSSWNAYWDPISGTGRLGDYDYVAHYGGIGTHDLPRGYSIRRATSPQRLRTLQEIAGQAAQLTTKKVFDPPKVSQPESSPNGPTDPHNHVDERDGPSSDEDDVLVDESSEDDDNTHRPSLNSSSNSSDPRTLYLRSSAFVAVENVELAVYARTLWRWVEQIFRGNLSDFEAGMTQQDLRENRDDEDPF
ncbi:hypothetical protein AAF712_016702, partial [Marasmius tenuissimus]